MTDGCKPSEVIRQRTGWCWWEYFINALSPYTIPLSCFLSLRGSLVTCMWVVLKVRASWAGFCIYLFILAPLSQLQATHGGGAERGVLGGLGEPRKRSWRVRTSGGLMYRVEPFVSDGNACAASDREACLGRCRELGLGLEFTSSCWGYGLREWGSGGGL